MKDFGAALVLVLLVSIYIFTVLSLRHEASCRYLKPLPNHPTIYHCAAKP